MSDFVTKISDGGRIAVDDTILVKDFPSLAGSKIMEGFVPLFSADAVERLTAAGYELAGKTAVTEFGLGISGKGFSGSAASLIAKGEVDAALSVDLNGDPERNAALEGVMFMKPTYGTVSRYGIIPVACSAEQIGVSAASAEKIAEILSVIAGHDEKDGTSLPREKYDYSLKAPVKGMKIGLVSQLVSSADDEVKAAVSAYCEKLKALGAEITEVSLETLDAAKTAWQILMSAECCNNLSRYDGVKFGFRAENYTDIDSLYINTRTEGLNFYTKSVILYGSDVLSKGRYDFCYDKALRVRRLVRNELDRLFGEYQLLLAPTCGSFSLPVYDGSVSFMNCFDESVFSCTASITGIPVLVTSGVQLMADSLHDSILLSVAGQTEGRAE